jgi:hypothetical protein
MQKTGKRKKSGTGRLKQLAQTLVSCAGPDVYFAQNDRLQQFNLPSNEPGGYMCIAPEQLFTLARIENHSSLRHRSSS